MLGALEQISYRRAVLAAFVLFVLGTSALEIFLEISDGQAFGSMAYDLIRFVISAGVLALLAAEYIFQQQELRSLREQLERGRGRLSQLDNHSEELWQPIPRRHAGAIRCLAADSKRAGCRDHDVEGALFPRDCRTAGNA